MGSKINYLSNSYSEELGQSFLDVYVSYEFVYTLSNGQATPK